MTMGWGRGKYNLTEEMLATISDFPCPVLTLDQDNFSLPTEPDNALTALRHRLDGLPEGLTAIETTSPETLPELKPGDIVLTLNGKSGVLVTTLIVYYIVCIDGDNVFYYNDLWHQARTGMTHSGKNNVLEHADRQDFTPGIKRRISFHINKSGGHSSGETNVTAMQVLRPT